MKKQMCVALLIGLTFNVYAQQIMIRDPGIAEMVQEISRERIQSHVETLAGFHNRNNLSTQQDPERGIGATWKWIKSEFESYIPSSNGRLSVEYEVYSVGGEGQRIKEKLELRNVVATLRGSDPQDDRILVVGAHMDSRADRGNDTEAYAPGANDDGSGIAAILEMARIMAKQEFSASVKFVAFSGEEHGLYGSTHMAKQAAEEGWNIIAMLNNDMIGNSGSSGTKLQDNMRVRVFSEGIPVSETESEARMRAYTARENDGEARQLARYVKEIGERYVDQLNVTLVFRNDRFGRGGDHTPFCRQGFTAVRICEFNENYHRTHKEPRIEEGIAYGDVPEHVDYEYVRKNTGINLATLANLATAPGRPQNAGILLSGMSNSSSLQWEAPEKGPGPKGYYILIRETYQPLWEKKIYVEGTKATIPYSKDNYFFAIQAVGERGHESLPVFPLPAK